VGAPGMEEEEEEEEEYNVKYSILAYFYRDGEQERADNKCLLVTCKITRLRVFLFCIQIQRLEE
jgi:hypothetical protein